MKTDGLLAGRLDAIRTLVAFQDDPEEFFDEAAWERAWVEWLQGRRTVTAAPRPTGMTTKAGPGRRAGVPTEGAALGM